MEVDWPDDAIDLHQKLLDIYWDRAKAARKQGLWNHGWLMRACAEQQAVAIERLEGHPKFDGEEYWHGLRPDDWEVAPEEEGDEQDG